MITIIVPETEVFDEADQKFFTLPSTTLDLEHSLASLSKWESLYEKPFLSTEKRHEKTDEEVIGYIQCMTLTPNVPSTVYRRLTAQNYEDVNSYISAKMTATWFKERPKTSKTSELITSELIYYWMMTLGVNKECENWHLNRLFTLIEVFSRKNEPANKTNKAQAAKSRAELNAQRRAQLNSRG